LDLVLGEFPLKFKFKQFSKVFKEYSYGMTLNEATAIENEIKFQFEDTIELIIFIRKLISHALTPLEHHVVHIKWNRLD